MSDDRLRDAFRALRRSDAAHAPLYSAMSRRATPHSRPLRVVPVLGVLAVCLVAVSIFAVHRAEHRRSARVLFAADVRAAVLSGRWESPTDFLLRTPGENLLHEMPPAPEPDDLLRFLGPRPQREGDITL